MNRDEIKKEIIELWQEVNRPGVDKLLQYLNESDFFTAPASSSKDKHLCYPGGLAEHSRNVHSILIHKLLPKNIFISLNHQSIIVAALGHDLCKIGYYKAGGTLATAKQMEYLENLVQKYAFFCACPEFSRFLTDTGQLKSDICLEQASVLIDWLKNIPSSAMPEIPYAYTVEDQFPMGHGEKSVSILQRFIQLTDEEALAIRWHMGPFDPGTNFYYPSGKAFNDAQRFPLVTLLFTSDIEATQIWEKDTNNQPSGLL